jgi:hypothetical protein
MIVRISTVETNNLAYLTAVSSDEEKSFMTLTLGQLY